MVLHNPNNWHWVNKDVSGWTKEYLEKDLVGIKAEKDGASAEISKLLSQEGDVEVAQRKGKVITIFDLKLQLEYIGKTKEDEDVSGTISVPEVAHDTEEDEYVVRKPTLSTHCRLVADPSSSSRLTCTPSHLPRRPSRTSSVRKSLRNSAPGSSSWAMP
jgi:activator of HSP90 ATPase